MNEYEYRGRMLNIFGRDDIQIETFGTREFGVFTWQGVLNETKLQIARCWVMYAGWAN
jgi:hypothetical protein